MRGAFLTAVFIFSAVFAIWIVIGLPVAEDLRLLLVTLVVLIDTIIVMLADSTDTARKLDASVTKLGEVVEYMKTVAEDIARRNLLVPKLDAEFNDQGNLVKSLTIPIAAKSIVLVEFGNSGTMSAIHAQWHVFFPRELAVEEPEGLAKSIRQPERASYPNYSSFMYPADRIIDFVGPQTVAKTIRFEITPAAGTPPGPLEIIVNGHSTNGIQSVTKLQILLESAQLESTSSRP